MKITEKGMLLVISGPSGCGKSTIVSNILARDDSYALSVSLTTREKREKEIDGVHYKFVTREDFEKALENDERLVMSASNKAQKAVDFVLNINKNNEIIGGRN